MAVAFASYTTWVALSAVWSHAPERAMIEADLPLVYGLAFVLFATSVRGTRDMGWVVRGLALGAFVVCLGAFLTRARPDLWPIAAHLDSARLGYPLTYWNALGLLATTGLVLCVGLTSDDRESRLVKTISALPVPLFVVTLLLTFSRGAIAAGLVALLVYALAARPCSLLSATVALVPTTAFAVVVAYRATSLATVLDGSGLQASQGRHVALVLAVCSLAAAAARGLLAGLDGRLRRLTERPPASPRVARGGWAAVLVLVAVGSLAAGLPRGVATQYDRFVLGDRGLKHAALRDRLTDPGANGRITLWRVALDEFDGAPLTGTGAGTYEVVWAASRPPLQSHVLDAHSVYLENLGELGVIGFVGLLLLLLGSLWAIARRVRGPDRAPTPPV